MHNAISQQEGWRMREAGQGNRVGVQGGPVTSRTLSF